MLQQPFKYNPSVRNPAMAGYPQPGQTQPQQQNEQQAIQQAVHVQGQEPLTATMLAAAQPQEQKQMLGKFGLHVVEQGGNRTRTTLML